MFEPAPEASVCPRAEPEEGLRRIEPAAVDAAYQDLMRLARRELAKHRRGNTLDTQVLAQEACMRLLQWNADAFADRVHLFATAARVMRHVVIDYARARMAERRGGNAQRLSLDEFDDAISVSDAQAEELILMDSALDRLSALDQRLAQVIELRFFVGLDVQRTAELLGVSEPTIKRDTRAAKAFLKTQLAEVRENA
ncbi:ECF-type sigma factor [Dokdonella ginsengisoli]|uniref:ECF-type sigma factor n=1 Tax=Dokdonella ginsengisoli TaxID=363846 RepID=A0ABV9QPN4_9GAMM